MLLWQGKYVVPWSLDSANFRYMEWVEGLATIQDAPIATYWGLVDSACTVGLLNCCLVDVKEGIARACPIVDPNCPCNLPETAAELTPMAFSTLFQMAMDTPKVQISNPLTPNPQPPSLTSTPSPLTPNP